MVVVNCPAEFAATAVDVLIVFAMFTLPQGFALLGRCTLLRTGVPETPRAGAIAACACAWLRRARTTAAEERNLANILLVTERRIGPGVKEN